MSLSIHRAVFAVLLGSSACGGGTTHSIDAAPGGDAHADGAPGADGAPSADADPNAPGTLAYKWTITMGGTAATCAMVGADQFEAFLTPVGQTFRDTFPCTDGADMVMHPADHYAVSLSLINSHGTADPSDDTIIATVPDIQEDLPAGGTIVVPTAAFAL